MPSGPGVPAQSPAASHPWLVPDSLSFQPHAQLLGSANWQVSPGSKKCGTGGGEPSPSRKDFPISITGGPGLPAAAQQSTGGWPIALQTDKNKDAQRGRVTAPSGGTGSGQAGSGTQSHPTCPVLKKGRGAERSSATQSSRDLGPKCPLYSVSQRPCCPG